MAATLGVAALLAAVGQTIDFEKDVGAVPGGDVDLAQAWRNGELLNRTFVHLAGSNASGAVLVVPAQKEFVLMGGVVAEGLVNFTFDVQGKLTFTDKDLEGWPRHSGGKPMPALNFNGCRQLRITGGFDEVVQRAANRQQFLDAEYVPPAYAWDSLNGVIDGKGHEWWGLPLIGYAVRGENRPRLLTLDNSKDVEISRVYLRNSAYWTFLSRNSENIVIHSTLLTAMREDKEWMKPHSAVALTAFNTDGWDFESTKGVHLYDNEIWNQDDCVAAKDGSRDILVERTSASGLGVTIGSIASTAVNVTFRDCVMRETDKAVYMKFREGGSQSNLIANITVENLHVHGVSGWPIWIGPAQQSDSVELCAAHPCSICWPEVPFAKCRDDYFGLYDTITLRNVTVTRKAKTVKSPGVLIGSAHAPMQRVVFDNVRVTNTEDDHKLKGLGKEWYKEEVYKCENVNGVTVKGDTYPVPQCPSKQ